MRSKINYIHQLEKEKYLNEQHQALLEDKLRNNWIELKKSVRPINIAGNFFRQIIKKRIEKNQDQKNFFSSTLNYGLILLHRKITNSAERKTTIHAK